MFEAHAGVCGAELPVDACLGHVAGACAHAATGAGISACVGLHRARACRVRTLSSGSALWSPLPCRGVNTSRTAGPGAAPLIVSYLTIY